MLDLTLLGQIKKNQKDIAHSLTFATSWSCTTETYVWPTGAKFVGTYQNNQKHGGLLSTFWCTSALQSCVANELVWKWATVIDGYRCLSVYHHFTMIFINSYRFLPFKWHKLEVHSIDRASVVIPRLWNGVLARWQDGVWNVAQLGGSRWIQWIDVVRKPWFPVDFPLDVVDNIYCDFQQISPKSHGNHQMPNMPNDVATMMYRYVPSLQVQARQASSLMRRGTAVASDGHAFESVDNWDDLGPEKTLKKLVVETNRQHKPIWMILNGRFVLESEQIWLKSLYACLLTCFLDLCIMLSSTKSRKLSKSCGISHVSPQPCNWARNG